MKIEDLEEHKIYVRHMYTYSLILVKTVEVGSVTREVGYVEILSSNGDYSNKRKVTHSGDCGDIVRYYELPKELTHKDNFSNGRWHIGAILNYFLGDNGELK